MTSILILSMSAYIYYSYGLPNIQDYLDSKSEKIVQVNYSNGSQITRYGSSNKESPEFYQFPTNLVNAVIAIEDQKFFNHKGFDLNGIMRAFSVNRKSRKIIQGGSTITQQLAKILFLKPDKNMKRKIKELILAFRLESALTKEQILTLYLNNAYFGSGNYGVQSASKYYFDKSVTDLSLKESAMLAALLKAPSTLSNSANKEIMNKRAELVIERMINSGFVDKDGKYGRINSDIIYKKNRLQKLYFADYVYNNHQNLLGEDKGFVRVSIDTTLDEDMQRLIEEQLDLFLTQYRKKIATSQVAVLLMNSNGEVKAISGGKDYQRDRTNKALSSKKTMGSIYDSFIYLYAFENGYTPNDAIELRAGDSGEKGGVVKSLKLSDLFISSSQRAFNYLRQDLGPSNIKNFSVSLGLDIEVESGNDKRLFHKDSLINILNAHGVFSNRGRSIKPIFVRQIQDYNSNNLYNHKYTQGRVVATEKSVKYFKSLFMPGDDNSQIYLDKFFIKSGNSFNNQNLWSIAFSDEILLGVWIGGDEELFKGGKGANLSSVLLSKILLKLI